MDQRYKDVVIMVFEIDRLETEAYNDTTNTPWELYKKEIVLGLNDCIKKLQERLKEID